MSLLPPTVLSPIVLKESSAPQFSTQVMTASGEIGFNTDKVYTAFVQQLFMCYRDKVAPFMASSQLSVLHVHTGSGFPSTCIQDQVSPAHGFNSTVHVNTGVNLQVHDFCATFFFF